MLLDWRPTYKLREAALETYNMTGFPCMECYQIHSGKDLKFFEGEGFVCFSCWGGLCVSGFDDDWEELVSLDRVLPHLDYT